MASINIVFNDNTTSDVVLFDSTLDSFATVVWSLSGGGEEASGFFTVAQVGGPTKIVTNFDVRDSYAGIYEDTFAIDVLPYVNVNDVGFSLVGEGVGTELTFSYRSVVDQGQPWRHHEYVATAQDTVGGLIEHIDYTTPSFAAPTLFMVKATLNYKWNKTSKPDFSVIVGTTTHGTPVGDVVSHASGHIPMHIEFPVTFSGTERFRVCSNVSTSGGPQLDMEDILLVIQQVNND